MFPFQKVQKVTVILNMEFNIYLAKWCSIMYTVMSYYTRWKGEWSIEYFNAAGHTNSKSA